MNSKESLEFEDYCHINCLKQRLGEIEGLNQLDKCEIIDKLQESRKWAQKYKRMYEQERIR